MWKCFLDEYDLSGKTIIPFNTHAGSRDGGTYTDISDAESNATVLLGFNMQGSDAGTESSRAEISVSYFYSTIIHQFEYDLNDIIAFVAGRSIFT